MLARILIVLWLSPIVLFALWIGCSTFDWSLGLPFMTREVHDAVFAVYLEAFGLTRLQILTLLQHALWFDVAVLAAIVAWRRRAEVQAFARRFASRSRHA